jgi:hypothetical protein
MKSITTLFAATMFMASVSFAAPWQEGEPSSVTEQSRTYAASANQAHKMLTGDKFGVPGNDIDWDVSYVMHDMPVSNLSVPALTQLITGRYHVFSDSPKDTWSVRYYGANGKTYFCHRGEDGYKEWELDRYIEGTGVGLAGVMHWNPIKRNTPKPAKNQRWGWPVVANPDTGEVGMFYLAENQWMLDIGWLQAEFPSEAAVHCPRMPRSSRVNSLQSGDNLLDMSSRAKTIRGFPVGFRNDPRKPLTAEVYYYLYPPKD